MEKTKNYFTNIQYPKYPDPNTLVCRPFLKKAAVILLTAAGFLAGSPFPAFSAETLSIIAVGDTGNGSERQKLVADAMADVARREKVPFVLLLGDNFYKKGVKSVEDKQWELKFEKIYDQPELQIPFYAVLGNHDYDGDEDAQVEYTQKSDRWEMPDKYYTFSRKLDDGTEIQFFALDTMLMFRRRSQRAKQLGWLEEQLSKSTAYWKIVYAHHPLYASGKHGDEQKLIKWLEPLLVKYQVDLYVSGHEHVLEALKPSFGVHYLISGGGAAPAPPSRIVKRAEDLFIKATLGFAFLRISREKIDVQLIWGKDGKVLYEYSVSKYE